MSQLDWVGLAVAAVGYYYQLAWAERWTDYVSRRKYDTWRTALNTWVAMPGYAWQPLLFIVNALATAATFLYWRNSYPVDDTVRAEAIMGLLFTSVFFMQFWTPLLLWGPRFWWMAALDSLLLLGSSTAALALMGVEDAWLPFGLYFIVPVMAAIIVVTTIAFWLWSATIIAYIRSGAARARRGARRGVEYLLADPMDDSERKFSPAAANRYPNVPAANAYHYY